MSTHQSQALLTLSPLDGRYLASTQPLREYFSESALMKYRLQVEVEYWLFFLSTVLEVSLTKKQQAQILSIVEHFSESDAIHIKDIEQRIHHDVKAIEYFLREKLTKMNFTHMEYVHFGLTSEDTNSIAYALAIKGAVEKVLTPVLQQLIDLLASFAQAEKATPMLARTHGQPAVPTTVGKEIIVVAMRLHAQLEQLKSIPFEAKLTGAVGNFNAHHLVFPKLDWVHLSDQFLRSLDLTPHHFTTQIVPSEKYLQLFHHLSVINSILLDFNQDMWRYISDEYFLQKVQTQEVGSSTMPHKVNPIDFENSEGNLGLANALLHHLIVKLPISRLQRDLSDSTVKRSIGSAFGYCLIGYKSLLRALPKIQPNYDVLHQELSNHWEIVTEGVQTILRHHGDTQAYEKLKDLSRGNTITESVLQQFIDSLELSNEIKTQLLSITPFNYLGLSTQLVELAHKEMYENKS